MAVRIKSCLIYNKLPKFKFAFALRQLAINPYRIQFLPNHSSKKSKPLKSFIVAPIKALCTERHEDWSKKLHSLNLSCRELTGDTDVDEFWQLQSADIILTTPV